MPCPSKPFTNKEAKVITLRNDPYFDEQAVVNRVKNLWLQLMTCRFSWDMEPLKPYFSDTLCAKEMDALKQDQESMRMRYAERPAVLDGSLSLESTDGNTEILTCHLFTRFTPRVLQKDTGAVIMEGKESFFHENWTLVRPLGTKTPRPGSAFSVNCPNCGAPFSLYKSAKCPMCHSLIPVPDFTWTVDRISGQVG